MDERFVRHYHVRSHETNPDALRVWHAGCDDRGTIISAAGQGVSLGALMMWAEDHERKSHPLAATKPYPIPDQPPGS